MTTNGYIEIPVVTDPTVMAQNAFTSLATSIPGWRPSEGNLEVLLIELFATMAAEAATVASDVPGTIFRNFGSLVGIIPDAGVEAQIYTTWTLINPAGVSGYQIPAGTIAGFYYQGVSYNFSTVNDLNFASGAQTATSVLMQAVEPGVEYNIYNLGSGFSPIGTYLSVLNSDPNVSNVLVTDTYATNNTLAFGTDPETDSAYMDRLSAELELLSPRPITVGDYARISQNVSGVYRSLSLDGFDPFTNQVSVGNDNLTTAASTTWTGVGNGTTAAGVAISSGALQVTTSSTSIPASVNIVGTPASGAGTFQISGNTVSNTTSSTHPTLLLIAESGAYEIVVATGVSGSSPQTVTISGTLQYNHTSGATVTILQGAAMPSVGSLHANSGWMQLASIVQVPSGGETGAVPYLVAVATYDDQSVRVFSSLLPTSPSLPDYISSTKLVTANVAANNSQSTSIAASSSSAFGGLYDSIFQQITSVTPYIVWASAGTSKVHRVLYTSLNLANFDFSGSDAITSPTSAYNWVPDAALNSYAFPNAAFSSWSLPSGLNGLPGFGIQYNSQAATLGSSLTASSPMFSLNGAAGTYTIAAFVDASNTGSSFADVSIQVVNAAGAVLATVSPTSAIPAYVYTSFSCASMTDVKVNVVFASGLNVPVGTSVVVSQMQVLAGSFNPNVTPYEYQTGYSWTPGGYFVPNAYISPRNVVVAPVDSNGLAVSSTIADTLEDYLEAYREINFDVNIVKPNYVPIDILWSAIALPGYNTATVQAAVNSALYSALSPANWASGNASPPTWDSTQGTVRIFDIAGIISSIPGVSNVTSVTTKISTSSSYTAMDLILPGIAPLALANRINGSVFPNTNDSVIGSV